MGKLRVLSAAQVCQILEQYDFVQVRQRGSHIIMQQRLPNTTVTVPVPNYSEIKIGTLQSIIRQSGLPRYLFEVNE
ncbi:MULTISPECIES: type II toxin-antitoxin system HicA family toxin [unclassified Microcoleus]|uniref:type II toxin-antitoxin system HicA family toxin n=1 Tax=unclassified Microcoleus TaxID=2642155 RepID=UPI001D54C01A|nr:MULTISPECIES: type II toxin-antitoxin system HicA family toxin [unclassified Microcoleus]TAF87155.1 MAG: type II toxin-antitoxin system HicA family toxin [Oscillatoriales cyanobacterium]MCC3450413.1 type II toxin-antitoxin system HicA family toxin [Microcoleus sp. PH2017_09_SFU_O_A]MCC3496380.1 type II toxin-antitoxin system HicA family toxin [Microcoleus sp. PH2017_15_JOR_U_A]MCC3631312.1 type II toxin-antitoxin system HicA family toxin [Microcoleus sp. PH2017_39_LGB_O_B]MCC3643529.1 type 